MIAILISAALIDQTNSLDTGAKMRHEANKMLMGIHNVPYDVADVLNGSNYSVEEATAIAAQRRHQRQAQIQRDYKATIAVIDGEARKIAKRWPDMDKFYDQIIAETLIIPDQERPTGRGHIRTDIQITTKMLDPNGVYKLTRNQRIAAKNHLKKAEAALAVLDKQGSPPETKEAP